MNEADRLASLTELGLRRVKDAGIFTTITRMATEKFGCPFAMVSIIDKDEQWFLAKTGIKLDSTPRSVSFCSDTITLNHPMLISDASCHPKYQDNPLVTGSPSIMSYLGIPIKAPNGASLGSLCIASTRPYAFSEKDIGRLGSLAELVEQCIASHGSSQELSRANGSLRQLNKLFKQAEKAAQIGSWRVDLKTNEVSWSDQVFAIHGIDDPQAVPLENAISFYEPDDRPIVEESLQRAIEDGVPFSFEASIRRADGELRRVRSMGERIDVNGEPECVAGVFLDCTEEHLRNLELRRAATLDQLTGLHNRSAFDRRMAKAIKSARGSQANEKSVAVMLIDLDGFKDVNDTMGHLIGDRLLKRVAAHLVELVDENSFVARWGGDEFAVLLGIGITLEDAHLLGERLTAALSEEIRIDGRIVQVGATCGLAHMENSATSEELMRRADLALYHAKSNDRGSVEAWSEEIEAPLVARQNAIATLTQALNTGKTRAVYQPIVELETGKTIGVESLIRIEDRNGQLIAAEEFFPALVDPLLSRRVSRFMIGEIAKDAKALLELYGRECRIGINVSEADLRGGDFLSQLDRLLDDSVLTPENITLEVTETMLLLDGAGDIRSLLEFLDQRGFTIALDDFGTGFSSLTHLRDFPIRKVKIDRDFIDSMISQQQSRLIVQAIVQMGRSLGLRMVAEGVETDEQHSLLYAIGCSHAQGYKYARPASIVELQSSQSHNSSNRNAA
ncbi:MAG: EAL domain-containing protein [Pseudomonadota bacterium]|nr:EAL domain-containing protein [Pseudomonadota bacterium]